jgi:hypothetical protein
MASENIWCKEEGVSELSSVVKSSAGLPLPIARSWGGTLFAGLLSRSPAFDSQPITPGFEFGQAPMRIPEVSRKGV